MADISARIFSLSPDIRYVAIYRDGELFRQKRDDIDAASDSESDRYEELLYQPALSGTHCRLASATARPQRSEESLRGV